MFPIELLRESFSRPNFLDELAWKRVRPNKIKQVFYVGYNYIVINILTKEFDF